MIIKKTYADGSYAIFKLLDIKNELGMWWLKGFVIESDVDTIIPYANWEFELSSTECNYEVVEVL